jgi:hypothetical protein
MDLTTARQKIVSLAIEQLDKPYLYGGTTPKGFDCEGLVVWIMKELGFDFTRGTSEEWAAYPHATELTQGCAVFFYGGEETGPRPGHVGIFIGMESPEVARMISAFDEAKGVCWSSFSTVVDTESTEPLAYWGAVDLAALVAVPDPVPVPVPQQDPEPLPSEHPTGETWPEIDAFLSRCGLGELEYIYKSVKPLFEEAPKTEVDPTSKSVEEPSSTGDPGTTTPGSTNELAAPEPAPDTNQPTLVPPQDEDPGAATPSPLVEGSTN